MKPAGKKETLLSFLERGIAMLHVDARRPGVEVPSHHLDDPHLRINLSYRFGIPDLVIDDEHVQATLSFGGRPFQCQLPWSAVFGITSQTTGDGQVWPEDLPTEVMSALAEEERRKGAEKPAPAPKKASRPTLVAVESEPQPERADASDGASTEPRAKPLATASRPAPAEEGAPSAEKSGEQSGPPPGSNEPPRKGGHLRLIR